ncbi:NAD(P)/FAD-dependent oxidoreductase [Roseococcus sp. YIM B11640]|uniref:NAD(P)/FAD-dependent oxidoreductase n=1 Tax=Roseococcus sp. YIM B11640 TaxID=3133973 RepID=UPI003C7DA35E
MTQSVMVLGAGMVGVSVALHLKRRGFDVVLVDRQGPGEGASFGNGGLIQREAVFPHAFPRSVSELIRIAKNRAVDVSYHTTDLPGFAVPLLRYWWHSEPARYQRTVEAWAKLIETCVDEHLALAEGTPAMDVLRPIGWLRLYGNQQALDAALAQAERAHKEYGVNYRALDAAAIAEAEPSLLIRRPGGIHWTDPLSVSDPHALVMAYFHLFAQEGGRFALGDATTLAQAGSGWRVQTQEGPVEAERVVVALGAAAEKVTKPLGYDPPLFGKRGYHMHYRMQGNAVLNRPVIDTDSGFALMPMRAGIRLTTGAEFAGTDDEPTPIQLERAEPVARKILPLADRVDAKPWMGVRPCMPDMLPVIGPLPGKPAVWCAFGHGHQGLTLGPTTGRLVAEMMSGDAPFVDPAPYRPERF